MSWPVEALLCGTPLPLRADEASAITKSSLAGRVAITRLGLGTALLEVFHPRQPCWKIEHRFDAKGVVKARRKRAIRWNWRGVRRADLP
jgi:hypothetical protein